VNCQGRTAFGLVDFGMAVDTQRWLGNAAEEDGAWRHVEVGGDCRYWPLSSWVMFMRGPQELNPGSALRAEYQTGLDLHALGITALQVLMEMSPLLPVQLAGSADVCRLMHAFRSLQYSWLRYWEDVSAFWTSLMKCFSSGGDWMTLKRSCIESGLDRVLCSRLHELRSALEDMGSASIGLAESKGGAEIEVLVRTLLTLLSNADGGRCNEKRVSEPKPQRSQSPQLPQRRQAHPPQPQQHMQPASQAWPSYVSSNSSQRAQHERQQRPEHHWQARKQSGDEGTRFVDSHRTPVNEVHRLPLPDDPKLEGRTPRASVNGLSGSSLTVRHSAGCSIEASSLTPVVGASQTLLRPRSASPLVKRPFRSGIQTPQGAVWPQAALHETSRLAAGGYGMYPVCSSTGILQADAFAADQRHPVPCERPSLYLNQRTSWATPCRASSGTAGFREMLFRGG